MEAARSALSVAHAPYSKRPCGCAFRTDRGVIKGATIENAAYTTSICAVSAGLVASIAHGVKHFTALHIANGPGSEEPCGRCLEHLTEHVNPNMILEIETNGKISVTTLGEMLPSCVKRNYVSPFLGVGKNVLEFPVDNLEGFEVEDCAAIAKDHDISEAQLRQLCFKTIEACYTCYAPISRYPVGSALIAKNDPERIITAANCEAAVIGNGLCAERSCICRALTSFPSKFLGIKCLAVCCMKLEDYGRPCGSCRQALVEWGDFPVFQLMLDVQNKLIKISPSTSLKILPDCFCPASL